MKLDVHRGATFEYHDSESGESYVSASQILKVVDSEYLNSVNHQTLELARMRGTDLHKYFFYALACHAGFINMVPQHIAQGFEGYITAIWKFCKEWDPAPLLLEEASRDRKRGVAGRPDSKLRLRGKLTELDLKTGQKDRLHEVQHQIYKRLEEYEDVDEMRTLYIRSDGTYDCPRVYRDPMHEAVADNALNILRWRRQA